MPTKTWYLRQINVGSTNPNRLWWDAGASGVAEATSATGWEVGQNAANNYANLNNGTEVARTVFSTTIVPNTTAPTVDNNYPTTATFTPPTLLNSTDSISTLYEYTGVFDAGTWTFSFPVRAVTGGGDQDGNIVMRVFRGLRSGTAWASVTEVTSALLTGTVVTNLTTTTTQISTVTWSAPAFRLQNEFLICKLGWQVTGAGGANTRDVALRFGNTATIVTANFRKQRYNIG